MLPLREYLLNFLCFPDLTQGKASIDKKNLQVEKDNAALEDRAEINGEMYVFNNNFVTNDNVLFSNVLKLNKLFCCNHLSLKVSHH